MRKSEIYDKRPTLGNPGESWDMFIVRKLHERNQENEQQRILRMPKVNVTIYYDNGTTQRLEEIDKEDLEKTIEFHSKPVNGTVKNIRIEEHKTLGINMDLDGYFALMEANTA